MFAPALTLGKVRLKGQELPVLGRDWLGDERCVDPLILIGDFNATPRYACYKLLTSGLRDAQLAFQTPGRRPRPSATFPSRFPMLRIDHLFVSPGVKVLDVHAPNGPLTRAASDHLPLVADFEIRKPRKAKG